MYNKMLLTYKTLNNLTPEYVSNMLKSVSQTHGLNLRSSEHGDLYVPLSIVEHFHVQRLNYGTLPKSVKSCGTLNSFKKCLETVI